MRKCIEQMLPFTALPTSNKPQTLFCAFNSTTSNTHQKSLDFHSGLRLLELTSIVQQNKKISRQLKWSIQIPRNVCSMRDKGRNRGPLWKGRLLSTEAIQAVQALKFSKHNPQKLENVFSTRIARLLKKDLLSVLVELQRQDLCDLALKVFETVRKEMWYKPDLSLYADMIMMLGRNKVIGNVEAILIEMQRERLRPDTRVCREIISSFLQVGMVESAMQTFELMKKKECHPDKATFTVLFEGLKGLGQLELAEAVREECVQYLGEPLENIEENDKELVTA